MWNTFMELYWMDLHTFNYDEEMKVKVKFCDAGHFQIHAYYNEQEILNGIPAWDDDQFTITVS